MCSHIFDNMNRLKTHVTIVHDTAPNASMQGKGITFLQAQFFKHKFPPFFLDHFFYIFLLPTRV